MPEPGRVPGTRGRAAVTDPIIGIDLGTTNCAASVLEAGGPRLIPNALGDVLTPSVVGLDPDGNLLVGRSARELMEAVDRGALPAERAIDEALPYLRLTDRPWEGKVRVNFLDGCLREAVAPEAVAWTLLRHPDNDDGRWTATAGRIMADWPVRLVYQACKLAEV